MTLPNSWGTLPSPGGFTGGTVASLTVSGLTATRVVFAGTGGLLTDASGFTFASSQLNAPEGVIQYTQGGDLDTGSNHPNADHLTLVAGNANIFGVRLDGGAAKVGFFSAVSIAPVTQQVGGVTLTNNVTAGGTTNQLDNYTSLTVYATDAAAIRNDIYQLGRKLKLVTDALRTYGLLQNADS